MDGIFGVWRRVRGEGEGTGMEEEMRRKEGKVKGWS